MPETTRPRGILSQADRDHLRGEKEYNNPSGSRRARQRIRTRLKNGIPDFALLLEHLEPRDRKQVRNPYGLRTRADVLEVLPEDEDIPEDGHVEIPIENLNAGGPGPPELRWDRFVAPRSTESIGLGGLKSTISLAFRLLLDEIDEPYTVHPDYIGEFFAKLVGECLCDAYGVTDEVIKTTVDIQIEHQDVDIDELVERFEAGDESITDEEVTWLSHLRAITPKQRSEYVRQNAPSTATKQ